MRRTTTLTALATLIAPLGMAVTPAQAVGETCDGKAATIVVPAKDSFGPTDPVVGTPGDDVIVGTEKNDRIDGAGGNDTICGLAGADTIDGGAGNDRLFGGLDDDYSIDDGYFGDLVRPGPGDDHVDLGSDPQLDDLWYWEHPLLLDQVSFSGSAAGVQVDLAAGTATGEGSDTIAVATPGRPTGVIGSAFDDRLAGTSERDLISAGGGDDRVAGRGSSDIISLDGVGRTTANHDFGAPPPTVGVLPGDDRADGGPGKDWIGGTLGRDRVNGGGDNDHLTSESTTPGSLLNGAGGNDRLHGTVGTSLVGESGNDQLESEFAPGTRHAVNGGRGRDKVWLRLPRSAFEPGQQMVVHSPRQRITVDGRRVLHYEGVDWLRLVAPRGRVTFVGSNGPDRFFPSSRLRVRAFGRGGSDVLGGGSFADLLDGGPGRDKLYGSRGRDRCLRGERLSSCERRR